MKWDDGNEETAVTSPKEGTTLFIACEGQYQYGNASLSWYDTGSRTVENDVFRRANGQYESERGLFRVFIGNCSTTENKAEFVLL